MNKKDAVNITSYNEHAIPRLLLAAAASGSGKTIITCGLLNLIKRRDIDVRSYKCGPDYIDPMFHRTVLGIDSDNLDIFFAGREGVSNIISCCTGQMAVIEGVMGIYDGMSVMSDAASSYDVARVTNTPIVLIVDAKGSGRTIISVIKGILADDKDKIIKGIILNNISAKYYDSIKQIMIDELEASGNSVELIGFIPKLKDIDISSRHLGLMLPSEIAGINEMLDRVADAIEEHCDVDELFKIAKSAGLVKQSSNELCQLEHAAIDNKASSFLKLAVARDEAFCFYYNENIKLLEKLGVMVTYFSPLHDKCIPEGVSGILLGGGYPELYLNELSGNVEMRDSIKKAINDGMPSLAECGGFMYLHDFVSDKEGNSYKLCGVIAGECAYTGKLVRFGYLKLDNPSDSTDLANALRGMKGHEFHYYDSSNNGEDVIAYKPSGNRSFKCMHVGENHVWGFPHLYYESDRVFIDRFVETMREYSNKMI